MTYNAAGNVRASATLAASGTDTGNLDYSAKLEGQVTVKNTPGGSVSATRGVKAEFFPRYGSTPATTTITGYTFTLPSAVASTAESQTMFLPTAQWGWKITNLDGTNAVTVEITSQTIDAMA